LEQEALILVFRVPQSVQKVKSINSHKALGVLEQHFNESFKQETLPKTVTQFYLISQYTGKLFKKKP